MGDQCSILILLEFYGLFWFFNSLFLGYWPWEVSSHGCPHRVPVTSSPHRCHTETGWSCSLVRALWRLLVRKLQKRVPNIAIKFLSSWGRRKCSSIYTPNGILQTRT